MKGQLRINEMFAFIVLDDDGTEGVPAVVMPSEMPGVPLLYPLLGADVARIESVRDIVLRDPMLRGKKITLARFSGRRDVEVIDRTA